MAYVFLLLALLSVGSAPAAAHSSCKNHGGPAGCDKKTERVVCADGWIDLNAPCPKKKPVKPTARELKFKPETKRGQILKPGEPPPVSTIEESQKDLTR